MKKARLFMITALIALLFCLSGTALAAEYTDVAADAWYAEAVDFVTQAELMQGNSPAQFAPNEQTTRAMTVTILHRMADTPQADKNAAFSDVPAGHWAAEAISWAAAAKIVTGYENGAFGVNDPVTREDIATLLWRYSNSPAPQGTAQAFADEQTISAYALDAVHWAREQGIIQGTDGGRFAPRAFASRAEVAAMLLNFYTAEGSSDTQTGQTAGQTKPSGESGSGSGDSSGDKQPAVKPDTPAGDSALVVYFSATGTTRSIANHIAAELGADMHEITPKDDYTAADLNYNDPNSRVSREHNDASSRPEIAGAPLSASGYDIIFLGYPIWWGDAPPIIKSFLAQTDLSGKTIIPFCTSASSGIGQSDANLHTLAGSAQWRRGQRFAANASQDTVKQWLNGLQLLPAAE